MHHRRNGEKLAPVHVKGAVGPKYESLESGRRLDRLFYTEAMSSDIHPYGLGDNGGRTAKHLARNNSQVNPITGKAYEKSTHASSTHHLDNIGLHGDWKIKNNYHRYQNADLNRLRRETKSLSVLNSVRGVSSRLDDYA